jgi:hypothetical protein
VDNPQLDPRELILRVADWVFLHDSEANRGDIRPNTINPNHWTLFPLDSHGVTTFKTWFYYHQPADPLFERRPTVYIPPGALQLGTHGRW